MDAVLVEIDRAPRRTLGDAVDLRGIGVHTGAPCAVRVQPAPFGTGVVLRDPERPEIEVPARLQQVVGGAGATVLARDGLRIGTVEHLLAALHGAGVTDATVEVRGPEIPILDGSARPFADALAEVGIVQGPPGPVLGVTAPVEVVAHGGRARITPAARCEVAVDVDFGPEGPRGHAEVVLEGDRFRQEVAFARTFVLARDVERLRAAGRGAGATAENTVVWGPAGPHGPLLVPDEPVRHKLLDLVGDLALLGAPLRGRVVVERGSHALHHALLGALLGGGRGSR